MSLLSRLAVQAARAYGILSSNPNNVSADYLVVAGGGGGGGSQGGGGGAGGYQTSTFTLSTLNTYSIAVGAGGNGGSNVNGTSGSNSSVSGTGLSTVTSTGGGYGGGEANAGASGGSGGGGGAQGGSGAGGSATSGQGFAGGSGSNPNAGGGGGASEAGNTDGQRHGGDGLASSISGSSVTYAGGGSGGSNNGTSIAGGDGGGGTGTGNNTNATAGTVNTGGGGGGGGSTAGVGNGAGGAGGSGIVIISYTSATPKFVGGTITTSGGKQIHTFTSSGTLSPITPITASYLVVAGGAGGGGANTNQGGGGGGAGGLLTNSTTLYSGATYVVTVGAGGTGGVYGGAVAGNGSNSVVSGTGLTTLTAVGGGGGGVGPDTAGISGGSGGGAGSGGVSVAGGTATSGQGNAGGANNGNSPYAGGGGGGAGAAGGAGGSVGNGNGGNGSASSISGTSVTYAGGGGAGKHVNASAAGTGGTGGGGNGGSSSVGVSGTTNLGGGGGGGSSGNVGGAGGSGIVIISYAGSQAFNGGLVTTSGGNTIHTFTSTGALTPLTNNLTNSLRFRSSASAYLNRTPSLATNRRTYTYSFWTKYSTGSSDVNIFSTYGGSSGQFFTIGFSDSGKSLDVDEYNGSTRNFRCYTTQVFRDPSAWYHIVVAIDTTQATSSNRIKIYVNGNQVTAFASATYPSQNFDTYVNTTQATNIGRRVDISGQYYDGYLADINFIDGQALEPYYFGNNDANGVWKPILYKGTYGVNGFYLTFGNTTSTTTLGYDSSPNGNNWTCNNISLTAGTTYDAMTDVPTNTSATVANYCVWNPLRTSSAIITNANLTASQNTTAYVASTGTFGVSSGKWYWESYVVNQTSVLGMGITNVYNVNGLTTGIVTYQHDGTKYIGSVNSSYGSSFTTNDIIGFALDMDAGTLTCYKNNVSQGVIETGLSGTYYPYVTMYSTNSISSTFGQRPFSYTPPTGFVALNTYNLPTPTILQGNKYMDATLYTGNGSGQTIVNQALFKPDFVWVKSRSVSGNPVLVDSVRGANKVLYSPQTTAEETPTAGTAILSFNSNGFSLGGDISGTSFGSTNGNTFTYVGWQWQAGQGSTSSNTSGSITSTVSVNTTAGFSIVTYTGTGSAGTVGHGLGVTPSMVIVKNRTTTGSASGYWMVKHSSMSSNNNCTLNTTDAQFTPSQGYIGNLSSSTTFSLTAGGSGILNVSPNGATMVAYCWAEIAGYSKFGSYAGNSSTDGPFIYLGFRPKFVIFKDYSNAHSWVMVDSSRNTYNVAGDYLRAESSAAENATYSVANNTAVDFLSNGFKLRNAAVNSGENNGSSNYLYMAWAENPFKNSNAR